MQKCIAVTGAASGIGKATAELFHSKGWYVGLFDINEIGLQDLLTAFGEKNVCAHQMDVTDSGSVKTAFAHFLEQTGGRLDVLFNNAGILQMGTHATIPLPVQHKIVAVNLIGILNCIDSSLPFLKQTPGSRIINMSSGSAVYGTPELAVYSSTKFAVRGLTEALNIEFEPHGIWVCDIMAPYVTTPMILGASRKAASVDTFGVNVTPDQVARMVWRAAHGRKVHWVITFLLKSLIALTKFANIHTSRFLVRLLAFSR